MLAYAVSVIFLLDIGDNIDLFLLCYGSKRTKLTLKNIYESYIKYKNKNRGIFFKRYFVIEVQ